MVELIFQDLSFEEKEEKVKIKFLKIFYFEIDKSMLDSIGNFKISSNKIEFFDIKDKLAQRKFDILLLKGFWIIFATIAKINQNAMLGVITSYLACHPYRPCQEACLRRPAVLRRNESMQ